MQREKNRGQVPTRSFVGIREFSARLGVTPPTAKRLATKAGIRRLGATTCWLLNPDDVDAYLSGSLPSTDITTETKGE